MKLKSIPEDFRVEELASWESDPKGDYSIYKVRKRKLTSFEAIDRIREATELTGEDITYAGLKDKQAVTTQFVAIKGRRIKKRIPGLHTTFVDKAKAPLSTKNLLGNKFTIVVRDLSHDDAKRYQKYAAGISELGLVNYFDDQRFGSIRAGQGFVARDMIAGRYELALQRLIAIPGAYDPPAELARKAIIRRFWGQWSTIAQKVRGSSTQSILEDLKKHPGNYKAVLDRMPARMRAVHLLAYQAYLWNEVVGRYLQDRFPARNLCQSFYACDRHIFWKECQAEQERTMEELATMEIPLLGADTKVKDKQLGRAIEETLQAEGIKQNRLALTDFKNAFYLEVMRPVTLKPKNLSVSPLKADDKNKKRKKLTIEFELPPGAYATLVLKRLFKTRDFDEEHKIERPWALEPSFDKSGQVIEVDESLAKKSPKKTKKKAEPKSKRPRGKRAAAESAEQTEAPAPLSTESKEAAQGAESKAPSEAPKGLPGLVAKKPPKKKKKKVRTVEWKGLAAKKERREQAQKKQAGGKKPKNKKSLRQKKRKEKRKGQGDAAGSSDAKAKES